MIPSSWQYQESYEPVPRIVADADESREKWKRNLLLEIFAFFLYDFFMSQPLIFRMIDKAVYDYNMIEKNDRILVGASGGKDSTALIEYFANRAKRHDCDFVF